MNDEEKNEIKRSLKKIGKHSLLIIKRSPKDENWEDAIEINHVAQDLFKKIQD